MPRNSHIRFAGIHCHDNRIKCHVLNLQLPCSTALRWLLRYLHRYQRSHRAVMIFIRRKLCIGCHHQGAACCRVIGGLFCRIAVSSAFSSAAVVSSAAFCPQAAIDTATAQAIISATTFFFIYTSSLNRRPPPGSCSSYYKHILYKNQAFLYITVHTKIYAGRFQVRKNLSVKIFVEGYLLMSKMSCASGGKHPADAVL